MPKELAVTVHAEGIPEVKELIERMQRAIGFFASVIKSGEPWTDECQRVYDDALSVVRQGDES